MKDLLNDEPWFNYLAIDNEMQMDGMLKRKDSPVKENRNRCSRFLEKWWTTSISIMIAGLDPAIGSATWYVFDKGIATLITNRVLRCMVLWYLVVFFLSCFSWRVGVIRRQIRFQIEDYARRYISLHSVICPVQRRFHKKHAERRKRRDKFQNGSSSMANSGAGDGQSGKGGSGTYGSTDAVGTDDGGDDESNHLLKDHRTETPKEAAKAKEIDAKVRECSGMFALAQYALVPSGKKPNAHRLTLTSGDKILPRQISVGGSQSSRK